MSASEVLAEYIFQTRYTDLPDGAIRAAKRSLLDTFAVAFGGRGAPGMGEVISFIAGEGNRGASSSWISQRRLPPRAAVFSNSFAASALDFDSLHSAGVVHADIVIVPIAVAVCEDRQCTGKDLLTAITLGDDVLCRFGRSTQLNSGWFYTSLYGPIAGAAITARLLGVKQSQIAGAMGLGFLASAGTQQPAVERSISKRMQGAFAAMSGVIAGYMSKHDLSGPQEIVEGPFGLYKMYEQGNADELTKDLGQRYENTQIAFKYFPSCQCNHAAIEGILRLRDEFSLRPDNVKSIEVFVSPYMRRLVGAPFDPTSNPQVAAQFSIQYSIAAVLLFGRLGIAEISKDAILDPRIADLVSRVLVTLDATNTNNYLPVRFKIEKDDGRIIERQITKYRGGEDEPLSDQDLKEKLALCLPRIRRRNIEAQVESLFDSLMNIDDEKNISTFIPRVLAPFLH